MRAVATVLVLAGLGGLYLWQKKSGQSEPATPPPPAQHAAASPAAAASPMREASEHNWMKRSLDRARDVRDQARTGTKDSQDP